MGKRSVFGEQDDERSEEQFDEHFGEQKEVSFWGTSLGNQFGEQDEEHVFSVSFWRTG